MSAQYLASTCSRSDLGHQVRFECVGLFDRAPQVPPSVQEAVAAQLQQLPFVYPGLGMNEVAESGRQPGAAAG